MRNINLYYDDVSVFKHILIYSVVLNKCVWIILLLSQSQEIYIQHYFAAEYNVFGFRYTGMRNSYVGAIAEIGQHLQKISLC